MDRREDQVVFVKQWLAGLVAGRIGRIERQLGEEALPRWIAAGNLFKLDEVGSPDLGILVDSVQMRLVPQAGSFKVDGPVRMTKVRDGTDERCPGFAGARRGRRVCKPCNRVGGVSHVVEYPLRRRGTDPGDQMHQPKAGNAVAGSLNQT